MKGRQHRTPLKPPALRRGDTIGIVTPGRAASFPLRVSRGVAELERLGYRVHIGAHALQAEQSDAERVDDLHAMFRDPEIRAVMLTLAGEPQITERLLPLIDYDLIRANPKPLIGQSAATLLLHAVYAMSGLVTYHGPSLVQHFGNLGGPDALTVASFEAVLGGEAFAYPMPETYADKFVDWNKYDEPRIFRPSRPWQSLAGGRVSGPLLGGSLRGVPSNLGSPYALDYDGAIFFWDLLFEPMKPPDIEFAARTMREVRGAGVIDAIAGMVVGRPSLYEGEGLPDFDDVVRAEMGLGSGPAISGVDCGHTLPLLTMPVGVQAELDADAPRLRLLEPAVAAD